MKKQDKELRGAYGCFIVGVLPIICLVLFMVANEQLSALPYTQSEELQSYIAKLSADKSLDGKRPLPENLKRFSNDGNCYVTVKRSGLTLVWFPTDRGMLDRYGYIYVSRSLQSTDYPPGESKSSYPRIPAQTEVGQHPLSLGTKFTDHWYQAIRIFD